MSDSRRLGRSGKRRAGRTGGRDAGHDQDTNILKGLAAGLVGGLVAAWTMNQFQSWWSRETEGVERSHGAQSLQPSGGPAAVEEMRRAPERDDQSQDDATMKLADTVSRNLLDRRLDKTEKEAAGVLVHYGFGATTGLVYGVTAELLPLARAGLGLPFGAAVWLLADEITVPALGLSRPPAAYPLSTHLYSLASHLVYGLTNETVRRALRRAM